MPGDRCGLGATSGCDRRRPADSAARSQLVPHHHAFLCALTVVEGQRPIRQARHAPSRAAVVTDGRGAPTVPLRVILDFLVEPIAHPALRLHVGPVINFAAVSKGFGALRCAPAASISVPPSQAYYRVIRERHRSACDGRFAGLGIVASRPVYCRASPSPAPGWSTTAGMGHFGPQRRWAGQTRSQIDTMVMSTMPR